jgi:RNA polymerase sigma factor (sigma-70 family)
MSTVNVSDVIVEGLEQELEAIFREHYRMVYRTAYGVIANAEDAEDIAQTIFVRLLKRGLPPDFRKNPKAYLYRAAVNESLNHIKARKKVVIAGDVDEVEARSTAETATSAEEIHRLLYEAVAKLNPSTAQILILRYVHKYSDAEIARLLGTSRGTIAVALYRARTRLRKWIGASLGDPS